MLKIKNLVFLALGLLAAAAQANSALNYSEQQDINLSADRGAHSGINTYATYDMWDADSGAFNSKSVSFSSHPAPFIYAVAHSYNPGGTSVVSVQGVTQYEIELHGPADTWMPASFRGRYELNGLDLSFYDPKDTVNAAPSVNFMFGDFSLSASCATHTCISTFTPGARGYGAFEITKDNGFDLAARFSGGGRFLTDANGYARANVYMQASAGLMVGALSFNGWSRAFIDPEFAIDPAWLAENPGATLTLPDGVGNAMSETSPIPEQGTFSLLLAGLGLVGANTRRRIARAIANPASAAADD